MGFRTCETAQYGATFLQFLRPLHITEQLCPCFADTQFPEIEMGEEDERRVCCDTQAQGGPVMGHTGVKDESYLEKLGDICLLSGFLGSPFG